VIDLSKISLLELIAYDKKRMYDHDFEDITLEDVNLLVCDTDAEISWFI
jgi:hypothetical protein